MEKTGAIVISWALFWILNIHVSYSVKKKETQKMAADLISSIIRKCFLLLQHKTSWCCCRFYLSLHLLTIKRKLVFMLWIARFDGEAQHCGIGHGLCITEKQRKSVLAEKGWETEKNKQRESEIACSCFWNPTQGTRQTGTSALIASSHKPTIPSDSGRSCCICIVFKGWNESGRLEMRSCVGWRQPMLMGIVACVTSSLWM